jgi:adenylate cyclase
MSPQVAERILASEQGAQLGGRNLNAAVLFTDIRGFTPLSETLSPEALVGVLNEYFTAIVGCVHERGGVLDKFIGDAAMAVFGLDEEETAAERAVGAALAMRERLRAFNESLHARGLSTIDNGVGVHFGPVLAGNIGSPDRLEYTVIGDTVNIASRLESVTKQLGTPVVVSEAVFERLSDEGRAGFAPLGEQALKGKSSAIPVYGRKDS